MNNLSEDTRQALERNEPIMIDDRELTPPYGPPKEQPETLLSAMADTGACVVDGCRRESSCGDRILRRLLVGQDDSIGSFCADATVSNAASSAAFDILVRVARKTDAPGSHWLNDREGTIAFRIRTPRRSLALIVAKSCPRRPRRPAEQGGPRSCGQAMTEMPTSRRSPRISRMRSQTSSCCCQAILLTFSIGIARSTAS